MPRMDINSEKFLLLIKARSPIYNYKDKEHANKAMIAKLWAEIADEMNCPVSKCWKKWTSLRNAYSRHLREDRSQTGERGKQRKKWHLADAMSFLKDFIRSNRSTSCNWENLHIKDDITDEISQVDLFNENLQTIESTRSSPTPSKRSRTTSLTELIAEPAVEYVESRRSENSSDNGDALFFKSLLADFEKLSSKRQRAFKMQMLISMNEMQEADENDALTASAGAIFNYTVQQQQMAFPRATAFENAAFYQNHQILSSQKSQSQYAK